MNQIQCDLHTTWYRLLGARLKAHWGYKVIAGSILTIGFNIAYFLFLYFPVFPVTEMPITALDRMIGFWSPALHLYMTLWIYISFSAWLLNDKRELIAYIKALSTLAMVGLTVFFFWPTSVPRPNIDVDEYPSFTLLVAIDEPRNVFPCLHAAFAVFSAICIERLLRRMGARGLIRGLNWCWCVCIVYSALATKQHLAVDLFAGAALALPGQRYTCDMLPDILTKSVPNSVDSLSPTRSTYNGCAPARPSFALTTGNSPRQHGPFMNAISTVIDATIIGGIAATVFAAGAVVTRWGREA